MFQITCIPSFSRPVIPFALVAFGVGIIGISTGYAAQFTVRAQTGDKVTATVVVSREGNGTNVFGPGSARLGSFGSPSINDKQTLAYACILAGNGLGAFTNNSVVESLSGKGKKVQPRVTVQAGNVLSDTFLPAYSPDVTPGFRGVPTYNQGNNTASLGGTAVLYKIGKDVAVNKNNRVAYNGRLLYTQLTSSGSNRAESSILGQAKPKSKNATSFTNLGLVAYLTFDSTILDKRMAINTKGAVAFNATFNVSSGTGLAGFAFAFPGQAETIVATVESDVIGLPYFTTFSNFSDAVITDNNVCWVVANLAGTDTLFDGIWQGNNPDLQPVVVQKDSAPDGGTFVNFGGTLGPSRDGKLVAFTATESNGVNGVYRADVNGANIKSIALVGDKAPENAASGSLGTFTSFSLAACNTAGQVAILGLTTDSNNNAHFGIWITDSSGGNLSLVVIEGQTIPVKSAQKTITNLAFNPLSGINRSGQVAFTASFGDRTSAVIVAKP